MAGIKHKAVKVSGEKGLAIEWNDDHEITGDVDQDQNQFLNAVIENRTDFPAGPVEAQIIYRTDLKETYIWDGTSWIVIEATRFPVFYDDFSRTTLNADNWTINLQGTGSQSIDTAHTDLELDTGANVGSISEATGKHGAEIDEVVLMDMEARIKISEAGPNNRFGFGLRFDYDNQIWFLHSIGYGVNEIKTFTESGGITTSGPTFGTSYWNWHTYRIIATASEVKWYFDGQLMGTRTTNIPSNVRLVPYFMEDDWTGGGPHTMEIDWVKLWIRK